MTTDLLAAIVASARRSAEARQALAGDEIAERAAARRPNGAGFLASLAADGVRVIAECKRRSPSRGVLRAFYDPAAIASGYAAAGAAAISVLTEPSFFDGSLKHLEMVRETVDLPLLRKDFIVTPFQIEEARAAGADAVLLIVAALDDNDLRSLLSQASALGLAALVEVHDRPELERASAAGAAIIGVNSRNLKTLEMHPEVFDELVAHLPSAALVVAESGLRDAGDLVRLRGLGYRAFLIGERFMTEADPGAALSRLLSTANAEVRG